MAQRKIHFLDSSDSSANFLYLKNQQVRTKTVSFSSYSKEFRGEYKRMESQTIMKAIDTTVKHVGLGSYNKCMSYISFDGISNFSKAIQLKPAIAPKGGRPRKEQTTKTTTPVPKKKKLKKRDQAIYSGEDKILKNNPPIQATVVVTTASVTEALNEIEKRKKRIKAKLLLKRENLLTQEEEQDIHTRADIYAMTAMPEPGYYILPQDDPLPPPSLRLEDVHIVTAYPPSRKKRRRNYGTTNCYVNHHNHEDVFDNTKMLPLGTRLLKPPSKLVELVAHATNGSPDGLLQVQQIYTFLQNKFPFFRYMERVAINSWRSSIRHALYQKWFRKIRFDLNYINSKGCYWAINHMTSPKEWTMPDIKPGQAEEENVNLEELSMDPELHENVCALLEEEKKTDDQSQSDMTAIAREFGISASDDDDSDDPMIDVIDVDLCYDSKKSHHVPSPVREQDPILAACAPDWKSEDLYLSSAESGCCSVGSSFGSPPIIQLESPTLLSFPDDVNPEQYHGIQLQSACFRQKHFKAAGDSEPVQVDGSAQRQNKCPNSPLTNWTSCWEEYGSAILSPQTLRTLRYCATGGQTQESLNCNCSTELDYFSPVDTYQEIQMHQDTSMSKDLYDSDTQSSEFEIIAEYSHEGFSSMDHELIYG